MMSRTFTTGALAVTALAMTTEPAGSTDASLDEYCAGIVAIETAPPPAIDEEMPVDEILAVLTEYRELLQPHVDAIVAVAPPEIADDISVVAGAVAQVGVIDGDPFEDPDVMAAAAGMHEFDLDHCGWRQVELTAMDYHFAGGLPTEGGLTSIDLVNEGTEHHEAILGRKLDSVEDSADEAFAAVTDEDSFAESFEFVGQVDAAPGGSGYMIVDLTPGEYVLFCPIPVGSITAPGSGPPHFAEGMVETFTIE